MIDFGAWPSMGERWFYLISKVILIIGIIIGLFSLSASKVGSTDLHMLTSKLN